MNNTQADIRRSIAEVIRNYEITKTEAWVELDSLSNRTVVEAIDVFEEDIKLWNDKFEGLLNVHCALEYGSGSEAFTLSETFPGRFSGRLADLGPHIDTLTVDTSGFRD